MLVVVAVVDVIVVVVVLTVCVGVSVVKDGGLSPSGEKAVVKKLVKIDVVVIVEVVVGSMVVSSRTVVTGSLKWVILLERLTQ